MSDPLENDLSKAGVRDARKHLFICLGPDCCDTAAGEELWRFIKQRVKETGVPVMRTKACCFRVCTHGPWLVIYPEGTWYGEVTPEKFERILQEHLIENRPIKEWITIQNDLAGSCGDGNA